MNARYLILLFLILLVNNLSGNIGKKGINVTLVFDSTFSSEIFEKKTIQLGNRELELKSAADTINGSEIFNLKDIKTGNCFITIYSLFTATQVLSLNLTADTTVFIKNEWIFVDTFSKMDIISADTIEFIKRNWACRVPMMDNRFLLKKSGQYYKLEKIILTEVTPKNINDFTQTVYKAKNDNNESKDLYKPAIIVEDLYLLQKGINQYLLNIQKDKIMSTSGGDLFIKVRNKVFTYSNNKVAEEYYYEFEKKYLR